MGGQDGTTEECTESAVPALRCRRDQVLQGSRERTSVVALCRASEILWGDFRHTAQSAEDGFCGDHSCGPGGAASGGLRAAEEQTGHNYETIGTWLERIGEHTEAMTRLLARDLHLCAVELNELWSFVGQPGASVVEGAR